MRTFLLSLLAGGLCASAAQAQTRISVGPRLGGNLATATFSPIEQAAFPGTNYSSSRGALLGGAGGAGRQHW